MRAEELLRHNFLGLETGGRNLVVQFEGSGESADSHSSVQRFEAGRLVEWSPGTTQDANLTLRLQGDIDKFILGVIDGKQSGAVQMNTADDGWTALPPMDVPKTCQLPRIPGATVILQRIEIGPPLGQFKYFEIFEDGELMSRTSGSVKDPDVSVTMTYEQSLRWRVSNIDLLTSVKGAEIQGQRSHLMLLFGLLESRQYRDYVSEHAGEIHHLIALSQHYGSPAWQDALSQARVDLLSGSSSR